MVSIKSPKNTFIFWTAGSFKVCVNFFIFLTEDINFEGYFLMENIYTLFQLELWE